MKINHAATKANFDKAFTQTKVAKANGHGPGMFHQVLNGTYPNMDSAAAQACVETLRKLRDVDGTPILVEEPEEEKAA